MANLNNMNEMNVMSFDVGIKNMAYCIFSVGQTISIKDWNILNLMEKQSSDVLCQCKLIPKKLPKKKQKSVPIGELTNTFVQGSQQVDTCGIVEGVCNKKAKYRCPNAQSSELSEFYCEKHAKMNNEYMLPKKECSPPFLKKMKIDALKLIADSHRVFEPCIMPQKRADILEGVLHYFEKKTYKPIEYVKPDSANDTDLICIGKNMKILLNQIQGIENITHVLIENQISPIANRMKTIQGMLAQYFIMINSDIKIHFISSINKLKGFESFLQNSTVINNSTTNTNVNNSTNNSASESVGESTNDSANDSEKDKYKKRKADGILCCSQFIKENESFSQWTDALVKSSKKDDLSDSFLQGIWFLKHHNIITYAENLKINSVY
jgi:hypothetical protein